MTKNAITNVVGAIGSAAIAAQPVLEAAQSPSLHAVDYKQLIFAVCFAVVSFFTGRKDKVTAAPSE